MKRVINFFKRSPYLQEVFVFAVMLAVYLPLQRSAAFADPDSLYHLKIAELTAASGPVRNFIWMPFSTLASSFADHHFLYHVALIPFIKIFGPLVGIKTATAVFSAAAIAALAWALRYLGIRYAAVFAILAGIMNPLAFRIGLSKASALGVMLLVIGLALAIKRRTWALGIVAFIYVWTHGSWPALLGLGTLAIIVMSWGGGDQNNVIARSEPQRTTRQSQGNFTIGELFMGLLPRPQLPQLLAGRNDGYKSILALWLGALAGLIINPFFPNNLKFYWEQIVQIALVNYQAKIGVGSEWYPYAPHDLVSALPLLTLLAGAALISFPFVIAHAKEERERVHVRVAVALSVAALIFLVMTLRSQRHVEYFVPLAVAAAAAWISGLRVAGYDLRSKRNVITVLLAVCCAASMVGVYAGRGLAKAKRDLAGSYGYTLYQKAAEYLKNNSAPGEIIVHADWDDMPSLFYWNDHNRYIMGLDPTFTYRADPERYWNYVNFTLGKSTDPVAVMKELNSRYVFTDRNHNALDSMLIRSGRFKLVYSDREAEIYLFK
jgi:hypothetical protein